MKLLSIIGFFLLSAAASAQDSDGLRLINGANLYLRSLGAGEPLLVIHGGPGLSHDYFLPHLENLRGVRLILYDQRACGRSELTDSVSLPLLTDDIEAIRTSLGIEKLNLLAHSWGAILAVQYAAQYGEHVDRLILSNPVPLSKEYDQEMATNRQALMTSADSTDRSIILGSKEFRDKKPEAFRKLLMLSFRSSFRDQRNLRELQLRIPANYVQASQVLFSGLGPDLRQYDYYDRVKAFEFPVLIIHGRQDAIPLASVQRLDDILPDSELEVFNKSGHFPFIEENRKFVRTITRFLH